MAIPKKKQTVSKVVEKTVSGATPAQVAQKSITPSKVTTRTKKLTTKAVDIVKKKPTTVAKSKNVTKVEAGAAEQITNSKKLFNKFEAIVEEISAAGGKVDADVTIAGDNQQYREKVVKAKTASTRAEVGIHIGRRLKALIAEAKKQGYRLDAFTENGKFRVRIVGIVDQDTWNLI